MTEKIPVIAVVGPTASGKTALAAELAKSMGGEVVSADSMQIYKGMDIATAKPDESEKKGVPHHMLDFLDVSESYSVAEYVRAAHAVISDIHSRGKIAVVAGGTGLYIDSLLENIDFGETGENADLRAQLNEKYKDFTGEELLGILSSFDSETAESLHPNNRGRILRAIEVYYSSGITQSEMRRRSRLNESPYNVYYIGLDCREREKLYERIDRRVDIMRENGLVREAEYYASLPDTSTASQAIGYKELVPYFNGELTLDEALDNLKKSTRHYAKRQLTWFKRNDKVHRYYIDDYDSPQALFDAVLPEVKRFMTSCEGSDFGGGK